MLIFKVVETSGLYIFEKPNENSTHIFADVDKPAILRIGEIVISYDFVTKGSPLFNNRYPTNYDWHLIVSQTGHRGWVARTDNKYETYLEELR